MCVSVHMECRNTFGPNIEMQAIVDNTVKKKNSIKEKKNNGFY